jgi:hypothetical protein
MKATRAQVQARVEEVLAIRLDGAEFWHVREYAREKEQEEGSPWQLDEGQKPLSDGQLWRYIARADQMIAESCRASRKKLLRRHLAQRRNLYAKAVSQGDIRAALAAVEAEARLQGLFDIPSRPAKLEPIKEPKDVVGLVASLIVDLRAGRLDNKTAATISGLAGTLLRSMEVSELEQRIAALEAAAAARQPSRNGRY